jgi:hypothetical protein
MKKSKQKKKYKIILTMGIVLILILVVMGIFLMAQLRSNQNNESTQPITTKPVEAAKSNSPNTKPEHSDSTNKEFERVKVPTDCDSFQFDETPSTSENLGDLELSLIGEWRGCVTTPWVPKYLISMTFKDDGTYSSKLLKASVNPGSALYYGTDNDAPEKTYTITNFHEDIGAGNLVIYFDSGTTVTEGLSRVKIMGNKLSFSFHHFNQYGPLQLELVRVNQQ